MNNTFEKQIALIKEKQEMGIELIQNLEIKQTLIQSEIDMMLDGRGELPSVVAVKLRLHCIKLDIRKITKELDWLNTHTVLTPNQTARKLHLLKDYMKSITAQKKCYRALTKFNSKRIHKIESNNSVEQLQLELFSELEAA